MKTLPFRRAVLTTATALSCFLSLPAFAAISVTVSPKNVALPANGTQAFFADVAGGVSRQVTWLVNGVPGGAPGIGTISDQGVYTAPAGEAAALSATVSAASQEAPLAADTAAVTVAAPAITGPTFYVATNGNDSANGSAATPWKTIQHAMATVPAGATVQVAGGTYHERVTVKHSGSASAGYITLSSASGQTATIDGTGLGITDNQGLVTLQDVSYVRIVGLQLQNYTSNSADKVPAGIYVQGSGNHIEIRNNHIHDIKTTIKTSAGSAFGLAVYGSAKNPISDLIVDGNELDHLTLGYSESLTINGNVSHWQVTNNTVHDNNNIGIDAIGFEGVSTTGVDQARDGWIAGNTVYNISSTSNPAYGFKPSADGIYVDGGTRITIERNTVRAADVGIELASEHQSHTTSHVVARSNIVQNSVVTGLSIGGYSAEVGGTDQCTVVNNTFFSNDTSQSGSGEAQIQFNATNNIVANNIFYANSQGLLVNGTVEGDVHPASLQNNLYFTSEGGPAATWTWGQATYATLDAFEQASGETDGLLADPGFVSSTTPDLHLSPGSAASGQGVNLGSVVEGTADHDGAPRTADDGSIDGGALQD